MATVKTFGALILLAIIGGVALVTTPILYGQSQAATPFGAWLGRSAIGVSVREARERAAGGEQTGVVIEQVDPKSPAEQAGLKRGDRVVTYDGEHVRSVRQFTRLVEETPAGYAVEATVVREGQTLNITVTPRNVRHGELLIDGDNLRAQIEDLNSRFGSLNFEFDQVRPQLGVTVQELSPQLADFFGATDGVLVSAVADGSPAAAAGLKAGDVITSVDSTAVRSRRDLVRALNAAGPSADVTVSVVREKKGTTVRVHLEAADKKS